MIMGIQQIPRLQFFIQLLGIFYRYMVGSASIALFRYQYGIAGRSVIILFRVIQCVMQSPAFFSLLPPRPSALCLSNTA